MTIRSFGCTIFLLIVFVGGIFGQQENEKNWQLNGYISDLATFDWSSDSMRFDNLIHNRLNFKWYPKDNLNIYIDLRSRLIIGDVVRTIPDFGEVLDVSNDYFDLSLHFPENKSWLFHTMLDRAYLEWYKKDWEFRIGRQRINWGVNLIWNPNDLFNAYSYFDFDYAERPGSDALRIKYYSGINSSLEFAVNMADDLDDVIGAAMYRWNKSNYDFQILAGKSNKDLTAGIGWAGNIGNAGFKGEATYFYPYTDDDTNEALLLTAITVDYAFKNNIYLNASVLFNSDGSDDISASGIGLSNTVAIDTRNLSPFRWSIFFQSSFQIHPLVNGGIATIYFPGDRNALFINPTIDYSIKENLDASLVLQWYYDKINEDYSALARLLFIRVKWNF